ncbi:hypothetical protein WME98_30640 [Sorangium sp. So ce296]|uniref:hypothetical protein n=1 Tax=Sorangium sp. So ce296 TaxID=3133296 RepID=UPI003F63CA0C
MLLLFTKLKENRPFYKRDLLNACTLPMGDRIQFAYRSDWLSKGVNEGDGTRLVEATVLIVFAEEKKDDGLYYHPVRFGVIRNQSRDHGTLSLDVELRGFFDYGKHSSALNHMMDRFQAYVTRSPDQPGGRCFVREDDDTYALDSCDRWQPVVQHIRKLEGLSQSVFYVLRVGECSAEFVSPGRKHKGGHDECNVSAGKEYRLALHVVYGAHAKQVVPTLSLSPALGSMSGPFVKQRSSGVEVDYWVSVKRIFQKDIGMLSVRVADGDDASSVMSPELVWLIRVSVSGGLLWGIIFLIVFGTAIASLAPEHLSKIGFAQNPVGWSFGAKVLGGVMLGVGTWLGFSRLPVKGPS